MDAKASHNNLKHLKNAVVREGPPVRAPTGAGAGAVAGAGMDTLLNTGTYAGAGPAVVDADAGSITSALKERLLDYGLEPTDLPKVRRRVSRVRGVWRMSAENIECVESEEWVNLRHDPGHDPINNMMLQSLCLH